MSEFLHGIYTTESTTGPVAVVDVSSSVIAIFGTSEKAEPMTLNHTTKYDDAYALYGEGSISKSLNRIHKFVPSNSVIGIPLGKDSDFGDDVTEPVTSGVTLSSSSAKAYIDDGASVSPVVVGNPHNATITYSSSNEAAATVDPTGLVTLVGVGETTITLAIEFDDGTVSAEQMLAAKTARTKKARAAQPTALATENLTYTLTVEQTNPEADKSLNGATLSASQGTVYTGAPSTPVTLLNPNALAVNYTSSDESVAVVDNGTGEVTPLAEGSATISVELIGDETYQSSTLTYEVTVMAVSDALLAAFIEALPLLRKVKSKYGFSAKIHLAPGILHKSGAASLAVAAVGLTRGIWVGDMPEDVSTIEEAFAFRQQYGSDRYMVAWPRPLVIQEDGSTQVDWFAPSLAGLIAQVDRNQTGDTLISETGYYCSPSNYPLVDVVGPSIDVEYIPSDTACDVNYLNANGIYSMINRGGGWHGFGNYSTDFPQSTEITSFICVRRTADIIEESIEDATLPFLDKPMFTSPNSFGSTIMGRVRDTVNDYLRSKEGTALVYSRVYLLEEDNPLVNLSMGKIKFRYQFTPPIPMQTVEYAAEIYVEALETAFKQLISGGN